MTDNLFLDWILFNWLEIIGFITALLSIYLQIKQKAAYWPVSMLMVSLYIAIYYNSKFYADMSLQFYYLFVSVFGWYFWVSGKRKSISKKKIRVVILKYVTDQPNKVITPDPIKINSLW